MRYGDSDARQKAKTSIRTIMDVGMGLFYVILGGLLLINKSFAGNAVPPWVAYLLGGMMLLGGGFRFVRGVKVLVNKDE